MISSRLSLKLIQIHLKVPPENDYFNVTVCTVCTSCSCGVKEHTLLGCSETGSWAHNLQILLCFTANSCPEICGKERRKGRGEGCGKKRERRKKGESSRHNGRVGSGAVWQEAAIHTLDRQHSVHESRINEQTRTKARKAREVIREEKGINFNTNKLILSRGFFQDTSILMSQMASKVRCRKPCSKDTLQKFKDLLVILKMYKSFAILYSNSSSLQSSCCPIPTQYSRQVHQYTSWSWVSGLGS